MKKQQRNPFKSAKKDPRAPEVKKGEGGDEAKQEPKKAPPASKGPDKKEEKSTAGPGSVRTKTKKTITRQKEPIKRAGTSDKPAEKRKPKPIKKTEAVSTPDKKPSSRKPLAKKPAKKVEKPVKKSDESIRLNRYISNAGVCSRRKADELIEQGKIKVNGEVVTELGTKVSMRDKVEYEGRRLDIKDLVYILLNKPKNTITTMRDPKKRKTVMDLIDKGYKGVFPVGRLDRNTTGVLLITNDGELAHRLTHPARKVKKIYRVKLNSAVSKEHLMQLVEGVELEDGMMQADKAVFVEDDQTVVGVEIHSGKNRIVRRMFEHLGYQVKQLERVIFGGLDKRKLRPGEWRELTSKELKHLRIQAGLNGGK